MQTTIDLKINPKKIPIFLNFYPTLTDYMSISKLLEKTDDDGIII